MQHCAGSQLLHDPHWPKEILHKKYSCVCLPQQLHGRRRHLPIAGKVPAIRRGRHVVRLDLVLGESVAFNSPLAVMVLVDLRPVAAVAARPVAAVDLDVSG